MKSLSEAVFWSPTEPRSPIGDSRDSFPAADPEERFASADSTVNRRWSFKKEEYKLKSHKKTKREER